LAQKELELTSATGPLIHRLNRTATGTRKEGAQLVYEVYGLTDEEIKIVA